MTVEDKAAAAAPPAAEQTSGSVSGQEFADFRGQRTKERLAGHSESATDPSEKAKVEKDPESPAPKEKAADTDDNAPDSSSGPTERERKPSEAQKRIKQLLADKDELQRKLDERSASAAPKTEERPPATREEKTPAAADAAAETFKETRPKPTINDTKPDGTPKFASYEEFNEDLVDWKLEQKDARAAFEREKSEKADKQKQVDNAVKEAVDKWKTRCDEARKRHDDFDEALKSPELSKIPQNSELEFAVMHSDLGTEILYHLAKNPGEAERISALSPRDQLKEIGKLEASLATSPNPAPKTVSSASKPPSEVSGRHAATTDAMKKAVNDGDFGSFRKERTRERISQKG